MPGLVKLLLGRMPSRLPSWPYLAAAAVIAVVGHYLSDIEILAPLRGFTAQLLADLQVMNPLNAIGEYYQTLYASTARCGVVIEHGLARSQCSLLSAISHWGLSDWLQNLILSPLIMLYAVGQQVFEHSSLVGKVVYLATLPLGLVGAFGLVLATGDEWADEWSPIGWAMFALAAAPCVAFAALAAQGWLIIFTWVFGKALAAIMWLITAAAAPLAYLSHALGVVKEAKELEEGHAKLKHDERG
jgi:hypothetical protein